MPVFLQSSTKIICLGVQTEKQIFEVHQSLAYGTKILAFVRPGQGGSTVAKLPVFNSVKDAFSQTKADMALIYSEGEKACNDIVEAIESKIPYIVVLSQAIPVHNLIEVSEILRAHPSSTLLGPGVFGIITPGHGKIGSLPGFIFTPGPVGFIASADSLAYVIAMHCTNKGIGQSTFVGIGGSVFSPTGLIQVAEKLDHDEQTEVIVYVADSSRDTVGEMIDFQERYGKKPMVICAPGMQVPEVHSSRITIVSDMTKVPSVIQEYVHLSFLPGNSV